jgi:hypothetical protein
VALFGGATSFSLLLVVCLNGNCTDNATVTIRLDLLARIGIQENWNSSQYALTAMCCVSCEFEAAAKRLVVEYNY